MLNKILSVFILGAFLGLCSIEAQTAPAVSAAPAKVKGKIVAARIEGHVDAINKADGQTRVLHDGDMLSQGMRVVTAEGASAILVFSNGATVDVAGDSSLDIDEFMQDPFGDEKISDMTSENGTSTVKLNLAKGELVGKVVHLNVDKGSEFTVQTPVGAAGIRGTTFRIIFRPGPDGKAFFSVVTAEGRVVFTGVTSTPVAIPAGQKVVVTFDVTSGVATTPVVVTPVTTTEAAQVTTAATAIATATANTTIPGSGGGGGGNGGGGTTDTTPSNPPQTAPATTSQTGSSG
jgi:hypothetical protein